MASHVIAHEELTDLRQELSGKVEGTTSSVRFRTNTTYLKMFGVKTVIRGGRLRDWIE